MNISVEKETIYRMMKDVTAERRRLADERFKLTEIYFQLKARLDKLDELETKGLTDISIKGYVDLHNETSKEHVKENIMREIDFLTEEEHKSTDDASVIPTEVIEKEKEKFSKTSEGRLKSGMNIEKMTGFIVQILKEKGVPMKVSYLYKEFEGLAVSEGYNPVKEQNFRNNILPRAIKANPKIERVSRGYYQLLH